MIRLYLDGGLLRWAEDREDEPPAPGEEFDYIVPPPGDAFCEITEQSNDRGEAKIAGYGRRVFRVRWNPGANLKEFRETVALELVEAG